MKKQKKQAITLLEIMIVIFLIGIIGSVIGYNMKGSLDEGKAFKTRQGKAQVEDIFLLAISEGVPVQEILDDPLECLIRSGLCKNPDQMLRDGWGEVYKFSYDSGVIIATSQHLQEFEARKSAKTKKPSPAKKAKNAR